MGAAAGGPWMRVASVLLHVALMLACLDTQAHAALRTLVNRAFFIQEIQLIRLSRQRPLVLSDVWKLPERFSLNAIRCEFKYNVAEPMFLLRAIVRMAWRPMLPLLAIQFLMEVGDVAEVIVTGYLLRCFDSASDYPWYHGYGIAMVLLVIKGVCLQHIHLRRQIRDEFSRVVSAIRLELFRLPLEPNGQRRLADIGVSSEKVSCLDWALTWLAKTCVQALGLWPKFAALYYVVGPLAFIPILSVVVIIATGWGFELLVGPREHWSMSISTDDNSITEVYQGIKAIKLFGWERMYLDPKLRDHDSQTKRLPWYAPAIRIAWFIIDAANTASFRLSTLILLYLHTQSPAFSASALTSAYVLELNSHVYNLCDNVEDIVRLLRLVRARFGFIVAIERALRGRLANTLPRRDIGPNESSPEVELDGCSFVWNRRSRDQALTDVSLRASGGELVAVVGKTGAGKSSLLLSICGELEMTAGTGGVTGTIAYLEQSPWIMNDTMRANVLFGREYDAEFFARVIHACALVEDIAMWPNADLTVIGERGINIS
ncbi:hypothetical protein H4R21_001870, partial [Coemansia helicoidea]